MVTTPAAPKLFLNAHCDVCEYQRALPQRRHRAGDLSLLTGLQPKEIEAWNERGIFTVTQLAHTFRPKTMGRSSHHPKRHSQQLQAMAIRDKTTYVRKRPEMPAVSTRVYLDVEGIPDTGLFYLIGLLVVTGRWTGAAPVLGRQRVGAGGHVAQLPTVLTHLDDYVVVHFGRYERDFVREMFQRYGGTTEHREEGFSPDCSMFMQPYARTSSSRSTATASRTSLPFWGFSGKGRFDLGSTASSGGTMGRQKGRCGKGGSAPIQPRGLLWRSWPFSTTWPPLSNRRRNAHVHATEMTTCQAPEEASSEIEVLPCPP